MAKLKDITDLIDDFAPQNLAFQWDNVGLQVGDYNHDVKKILLSLDITEKIIEEAIDNNCQLVISHHPLLFNGINSITCQDRIGRIIIKAIKNGLAIFSAHTNLDIVKGGLNDLLAEKLGLIDTENLDKVKDEEFYKLVVYIPENHFLKVKNAILEAGAGKIGNYSYSSFSTKGEGTFKPLVNSNPYIGKEGEISRVKEVRFETIIPAHLKNKIIRVILDVHPYEEVAYDLYPLINNLKSYGLGRIGRLEAENTLAEFVPLIKKQLNLSSIKVVGSHDKKIRKVALCSGSGADLIKKAKLAGADLYITSDVKYHEAQLAEELELALVDAGHYETEIIVKELLRGYLKDKTEEVGLEVEILESQIDTNPWNYDF